MHTFNAIYSHDQHDCKTHKSTHRPHTQCTTRRITEKSQTHIINTSHHTHTYSHTHTLTHPHTHNHEEKQSHTQTQPPSNHIHTHTQHTHTQHWNTEHTQCTFHTPYTSKEHRFRINLSHHKRQPAQCETHNTHLEQTNIHCTTVPIHTINTNTQKSQPAPHAHHTQNTQNHAHNTEYNAEPHTKHKGHTHITQCT